jgi:hypothetical protein
MRSFVPLTAAVALGALLVAVSATPAQDKGGRKQDDVDKAVERGCEYLRKQQNADGSWSTNGAYPTVMTAMGGLALLMEGSTPKEGRYSDELKKAVDWFLTRSQDNGLLGNPQNPTEGSRYIYGHGFGMLFLACVYGEEEDPARRKKLEALLKKAVEFSGKAQTQHGGWGYVSSRDGGGFDEGSTTITQLQGLRACRNAGIVVPKAIIDKAVKYLKDCTTTRGGLVYNYSGPNPPAGGECQAITAAACACAFSSGNYDDKHAKMWIKYCKEVIYLKGRVNGHDEYQNYYFSQVIYVLGDDRYQKLFPDERKENGILWSDYKKSMFDHFLRTQGADGGWQAGGGWGVGPIFATGTALMILQLEKNLIPFYHR